MYGINHPSQLALTELAFQVAEKIAEKSVEAVADLHKLTKDHLAHIVWPVYPEISAHLGVQGSYHWRVGDDYANLMQFIDRSFRKWDKIQLRTEGCQFVPSISKEHTEGLKDFWG